jgi:hypothetical protein
VSRTDWEKQVDEVVLRGQKIVRAWIGDHRGHSIGLRVLDRGREQRVRIEPERVGNQVLTRDPSREQIVRERLRTARHREESRVGRIWGIGYQFSRCSGSPDTAAACGECRSDASPSVRRACCGLRNAHELARETEERDNVATAHFVYYPARSKLFRDSD